MQSSPDMLQSADRFSKEKVVEALAEKASRHFGDFCRYVDSSYLFPPHLKLLHKKLEAVERGECQRLMVFMPPRHGKSETASRKFPAWFIGRNPDKNVIETSYAHQLAMSFSREARDLVDSRRYRSVFPIRIARDSRSVNDWGIFGRKGGMMAAGVGGATTGYGADLFIIDDPFKNKEEADSEVIREKVWDWYRSVVLTRLEPGGSIVLIMTRWHQDDLAGRILKEDPDWDVVNIPAVAEENDPIGRQVGEALWPKRYTLATLEQIKRRVGSRIWAALFQGHPMDPESALFVRSMFRRYKALPMEYERFGGIDTATSTKTLNDFSALVDVCKDWEKYLYVDDVFLDKVSVTTLARHVSSQQASKKYRDIYLEKNNAGEAVRQRVEEVGREDETNPPVTGITVSTDKVVRASEWAHLVETGVLKFKLGNKKVEELIDHLCNFDGKGGDTDDDVDALGHAIKAATGGASLFTLDTVLSQEN